MLTKRIYLNLINKLYYQRVYDLRKKTNIICFINLSFRLEQKLLLMYQFYIYFLLSIYFGQLVFIIPLKKEYRRLGLDKGYPLGSKLHLKDMITFYNFLYYFNKWYYFNIFGELKSFFFDKKNGNFFGLKFPFLNLFYLFDYNLITLFLYNLNIPNIKFFVFSTSDKFENIILKNVYGFF